MTKLMCALYKSGTFAFSTLLLVCSLNNRLPTSDDLTSGFHVMYDLIYSCK